MDLIRRALISVSDKTGLIDFARFLVKRDIEILSTGGTASALRIGGIPVRDVGSLTEFPEIMDGRIKTLHPRIYGGLLGLRDNASHRRSARAHGILDIDLLVVNLYPFEEALSAGCSDSVLIEKIDIGGPSMLRAGAKNAQSVVVVTDISDYSRVMEEMDRHGGGLSDGLRLRLATRAFSRTASYDLAISRWMLQRQHNGTVDRNRSLSSKEDPLDSDIFTITGVSGDPLRYGENPHQRGRFYRISDQRPGVGNAKLIQGKDLSYNNIQDADSAFECVSSFDDSACAAVCIIKHATPCGVGLALDLSHAYEKAYRCDPVSAFGGIVGLNRWINGDTARLITNIFTELVIAPGVDEDARAIFAKKPSLRVLETGRCARIGEGGVVFRSVCGGILVQHRDEETLRAGMLKTVTKRSPTTQELEDLLFAFTVCRHVKSNAIVFARDRMTVGIGSGQMSRLDSVYIASRKGAEGGRLYADTRNGKGQKAGQEGGQEEGGQGGGQEEKGKSGDRLSSLCIGSVAASDAFFPFPDALEAIIEAGATAIIQPGGARRDEDVIAAADSAGIAMVFTGMRHFRH